MHVNGQNLIIKESLKAEEGDIRKVLTLWENYYDFMAGGHKTPGSGKEKDFLFEDLISHTMTPQWSIYSRGNNYTFDIRKIDEKFYEINNILYFDFGATPEILFIYRHCAFMNDENQYELCSYFESQKAKLGHYSTEYIDFYYPSHYPFDRNKAEETGVFMEGLIEV